MTERADVQGNPVTPPAIPAPEPRRLDEFPARNLDRHQAASPMVTAISASAQGSGGQDGLAGQLPGGGLVVDGGQVG